MLAHSTPQTLNRWLCSLMLGLSLALAVDARAQPAGMGTQVVLATYRLENAQTTGTAFVVRRAAADDKQPDELFLVTAAHAFEEMTGAKATLVLRQPAEGGDWKAAPWEFTIRDGDQPRWHKHPQQDVAVLRLEAHEHLVSLPLEMLATAADWTDNPPEPGTLVRCVGYPHAAQFKPSAAGFPLTRLGCLASYPVTPFAKQPTFLVDYNSFEGDSGGPVYLEMTNHGQPQGKIVGLVQGQHFLDERYKLVYQEGLTRKRLGIAIVVNSQAILETITAMQ